MKIPPDQTARVLLAGAGVLILTMLFLRRSVFLFIPVFALIIFLLWRRGGGNWPGLEDDDPADWWKKGKPFGDR